MGIEVGHDGTHVARDARATDGNSDRNISDNAGPASGGGSDDGATGATGRHFGSDVSTRADIDRAALATTTAGEHAVAEVCTKVGQTDPAAAGDGGELAAPPRDIVSRIVAIMARLRDPERGCEWDRVQTFETIAPYTIEEAYEVADAIARGDTTDLKDELGDLLLQVVFHSRIAEEAGLFDLGDVVDAISDKMERRHPHIFGDAEVGGHHLWEQVKAAERREKTGQGGALAGVALGLPALSRAEKLQKRAARVGFDWPDAAGPRAKIDEELAEVEAASDAGRMEEVGDLLFSVVNWARHLGIDPEAALRAANAKFERRFAAMEAEDANFGDRTLAEMEEAWVRAKVSPLP